MDKVIGNTVKKLTKEGEKKAPIKSVKIKIKFQKAKGKKQRKANVNDPSQNSTKSNQVPPLPYQPTVGRGKSSMNKLKRGMRGYRK